MLPFKSLKDIDSTALMELFLTLNRPVRVLPKVSKTGIKEAQSSP